MNSLFKSECFVSREVASVIKSIQNTSHHPTTRILSSSHPHFNFSKVQAWRIDHLSQTGFFSYKGCIIAIQHMQWKEYQCMYNFPLFVPFLNLLIFFFSFPSFLFSLSLLFQAFLFFLLLPLYSLFLSSLPFSLLFLFFKVTLPFGFWSFLFFGCLCLLFFF